MISKITNLSIAVLVALVLVFVVVTTPASAQVMSPVMKVELTFDGHLCLECEFGAKKLIAEKEMGWIRPTYTMDLRDQGKVTIELAPGSKVDSAKIVVVVKKRITRASLTQIRVFDEKGQVVSVTKVPTR